MHKPRISSLTLLPACLLSSVISTAAARDIDPSINGAWYDASQPGQGFIINIAEAQDQRFFVATWYTYDNHRQHMWLSGSAPLTGMTDTLTLPMQITSGGVLGSGFLGSAVQSTPWGTLSFTFDSCNTGSVDYRPSVSGFESGTIQLSRLTHTAGLMCSEDTTMQTPENEKCALSGTVMRVSDGDTITLEDSAGESTKIRLQGIDTPELDQPYGPAARDFLSAQIGQQSVCATGDKTDQYGRFIGTVWLGEVDINLALIDAGYAWHYKQYQNEQTPEDRLAYSTAEEQARQAAMGLWSEPDPIAPWDWRRGVRPGSEAKRSGFIFAPAPD